MRVGRDPVEYRTTASFFIDVVKEFIYRLTLGMWERTTEAQAKTKEACDESSGTSTVKH